MSPTTFNALAQKMFCKKMVKYIYQNGIEFKDHYHSIYEEERKKYDEQRGASSIQPGKIVDVVEKQVKMTSAYFDSSK